MYFPYLFDWGAIEWQTIYPSTDNFLCVLLLFCSFNDFTNLCEIYGTRLNFVWETVFMVSYSDLCFLFQKLFISVRYWQYFCSLFNVNIDGIVLFCSQIFYMFDYVFFQFILFRDLSAHANILFLIWLTVFAVFFLLVCTGLKYAVAVKENKIKIYSTFVMISSLTL